MDILDLHRSTARARPAARQLMLQTVQLVVLSRRPACSRTPVVLVGGHVIWFTPGPRPGPVCQSNPGALAGRPRWPPLLGYAIGIPQPEQELPRGCVCAYNVACMVSHAVSRRQCTPPGNISGCTAACRSRIVAAASCPSRTSDAQNSQARSDFAHVVIKNRHSFTSVHRPRTRE